MTVSDARRTEMYMAFCNSMGTTVADTLIESLPPADWSDLARKSDVALVQTELGSRITNVEKDIDRIYKSMAWVIGVTTTFGIATVALLVQLSFAVAGLK